MKLIRIRFSNNAVRTFDMETISIEDMINFQNCIGCEVIDYIDYKMEV